jgi:hypothetical protein
MESIGNKEEGIFGRSEECEEMDMDGKGGRKLMRVMIKIKMKD